jgi:hypothetical protein
VSVDQIFEIAETIEMIARHVTAQKATRLSQTARLEQRTKQASVGKRIKSNFDAACVNI